MKSSVALNMACYDTTKSEPVNLCVTIGVTNTRESPLFAIKQMYENRYAVIQLYTPKPLLCAKDYELL